LADGLRVLDGRPRVERGAAPALAQRLELPAHPEVTVALRRGEVASLARIRREVVELGVARLDQLPAAVLQRLEVAPREVEARVVRLGVGRALLERALGREPRAQAAPVGGGR